VQLAILGPLTIEDGAQRIEVGGARLRALLIRLGASANGWVPVSSLVEALWEEDPPGDELNALQSLISRLRRALPRPELIESGPAGYRLAIDPESVDAILFERLAGRGRGMYLDGHHREASATLTQALDLWRGPALMEVADASYAVEWIERLEKLRLTAIDNRAAAGLQLGQHADLIAELEEVAARYPLRERSHELLIRALAGVGRQNEALAVFDRLGRTLAEEVGLYLPAHLQELRTAVLRDDPKLRPTTPGPAKPAGRRRQTNLRAQLTSFIGRKDDVTKVRSLLSTSRLVTLVGTGGAGKTRLAHEAASGLQTSGADGVWMVELAPVTDPDDIASTALGSIGGRDSALLERTASTHRDALSRLVDTLADHDVVLVLDNCEHLVDAAAKFAEYLLGQCPGLTVLATSREPLGVVGETLWPVTPLPFPRAQDPVGVLYRSDAVRLFTDRATLVRPGFELTSRNQAAVSEICRRLDGLPLAIELAAARLRSLPVETVAARLSNRFRLLTGGNRTAMPRHQTLRAVVAWSWELLTESERRLAERLSVFPGGATAITAEAICARGVPDLDDAIRPDSVADLLAALADKSLLFVVDGSTDDRGTAIRGTDVRGTDGRGIDDQSDDEPADEHVDRAGPRYRMLETIREYASEQLADRDEVLALRRAHAKYFLDLAETAEPKLRGADQLIWLDRLTAERDNLLATLRFAAEVSDAGTAIRLAAALSWYWTLLGRHDEAAIWLAQALTIPGERSPEAYAIVRVVHTMSAAAAGLGVPELPEVASLLNLLEGLDTLSGHPLLALVEPGIAMILDDGVKAQEAVRLNLVHADPWARAMLYMMSAMMAENDGDLELMEENLPPALNSFREIGDRWGIGVSVAAVGMLRSARGDTEGAIAATEEARQMMTQLRAKDDEAYSLVRIGLLRLRLADLDGARRDIEEAVRMADETGASASSAAARSGLSLLSRFEGDYQTAREQAEQALVILDRAKFTPPQVRAMLLGSLAGVDVVQGRFDEARKRLAEAVDVVRSVHDMPVLASITVVAADLTLASGTADAAAELLGAAASIRGMDDVGDLDIQRIAAAAQTALGAERFTKARARGEQLTRPDALSLLDTTLGIDPPPNPV
jgi:predicted ATPase/DNA-binding SARP family transcriptional activator